jgi:2-hydroxymuconate-semialdehyde hydrolase
MQSTQIAEQVRRFIVDEFLEGDEEDLDTDSPLLEWGIIDSIGMVSLVGFLENNFSIHIAQSEITPTNFHSLDRISTLVVRHTTRPPSASSGEPDHADPELLDLLDFGAQRVWSSLDSGARLHSVVVAGPEPTWLVLPEPGESAAAYGDILRALEGHHRAEAVDLPGFGVSSCPNPEPTFWDHAALLTEWLRAQPNRAFVILGHGLSAALALELAQRLPQHVRAVVALGFGDLDAPRNLLEAEASVEGFVNTRRVHASSLPASCRLGIERRLAHPAFASFLDAEAEAHLPRLLSASSVPTLFIGALDDQLVERVAIERAAESVERAQIKWLARIGHAFPIERADETVSLMLGYHRALAQGELP